MTNENHKGVSPPYNPPGKRKTKDKNFKTKITEEERTFLKGKTPLSTPFFFVPLSSRCPSFLNVSIRNPNNKREDPLRHPSGGGNEGESESEITIRSFTPL